MHFLTDCLIDWITEQPHIKTRWSSLKNYNQAKKNAFTIISQNYNRWLRRCEWETQQRHRTLVDIFEYKSAVCSVPACDKMINCLHFFSLAYFMMNLTRKFSSHADDVAIMMHAGGGLPQRLKKTIQQKRSERERR